MAKIDYLSILEAAWQQHLAPRAENAPTVISTFAGGGGSSLGYSMAGFRELLAVEWDDNAAETFRLNFPDVPIYHGDIAKLSVTECLELARVEPGELDVLDGSPPCQGFSMSGKRKMEDERNQLFREYVRLLRGLKPKVFVMENVPGLVRGKMKLVFAEIMRELKASGYQVKCKKLNAMYFNVPQSRERLIFIGIRDDLKICNFFPQGEKSFIAVKDAIINANIQLIGVVNYLNPNINDMQYVKAGSNLGSYRKSHNFFSWVRCPWNDCAMTLAKSVTYGNFAMWHPKEHRTMSIGELKRIQSFSDNFKLTGKFCEQVSILGNSVPPLFMRAIATHIRESILDKTAQSRTA